MATVAPAVLYAVFVWWFSTGLVLLLVLRQRKRVCVAVAAMLFPAALYLLSRSGAQTSVAGAYVAFTAAILLWGTQEIAFLTGFMTGPRPLPCPPGAVGAARLRYALGAILYHEIALIGSGVIVVAITWGAPNEIGALTFLILWIMRASAKVNLYLGVPVLNDQALPAPIGFLRSYFSRGPVNGFFPVAVVVSVLILSGLVTAAGTPDASAAAEVGYELVAALMALAILEHVFMLVPLPLDRLWAWSGGSWPSDRASAQRASADLPQDRPGKVDRVAATLP